MKRALAAALIVSPLFALPATADERSSVVPDRPFGADTTTQIADARAALDLASSGTTRDSTGKPARNSSGTEGRSGVDDTVTGGDPKGD